ncbi:MAG: bifunctional response regulator/alkaline phosphatase family protein [Gemmatimonadota bacterium]
MNSIGRRILWVDDEIELLRPHLLLLQQRGFHVDAIPNGDDALALLKEQSYDLVLLDEQMPGRRGLEVLEVLRRDDPFARVVMITKSEQDRTLTEAIGRRVDDYLVKPTSPLQVVSAVTRILQGRSIRQQQTAQDFAARFPSLSRAREDAETPEEYMDVYAELVDWHLRLEEAGEAGLLESVDGLTHELRRDFGFRIRNQYPEWVRGTRKNRPTLSVDLVREELLPIMGDKPVFFVILDCMRLDQWRAMVPLLSASFEVEERHYLSILPTATPYSRNAIFSGLFPDEIEEKHPGWWDSFSDEGSVNDFEDELLRTQLRRLTGKAVPVHYEKVFTDRDADAIRARVRSGFKEKGAVVALVSSFVDLMTHGRSESQVLMEMARDDASLRDLTLAWFERSLVFQLLREAAAAGISVLITTDHGSVHCHRPSTVFARKDATPSLRYKFGADLRAEKSDTVFATSDPGDLRLPPPDRLGTQYVLAMEDYFLVYPTRLREYQARYRGSFLHGGVSPDEMILPVARLTPRAR